ncbi:MAG TPA: response regulator [Gemmatimonadales bacterium]|nr:response regulator [Gemmatimonadales bacterium]
MIPTHSEVASTALAPTPLRILLLEDVPMDAELLEYELARAGIVCETRCVSNREAFVRELEAFAPQLILSDYSLPGFDGMAALRLARELAPAVPFIVVTGSINEETAVGCMRAGAADYLLKNNLARIGPAIAAALERERSRAQQRQAELALRRSEAHLRAIFSNALQDYVLLDPEGRVLMVNKASSDWARWVTGGEVRVGDRLRDLLPAGIREEWDRFFALALERQPTTIEREVQDPVGRSRWFEASFFPVTDDGAVLGVCLGVLDIDARKTAEDHFRRAERMEAVGRLAGGVAHEVNNMMTVILGFGGFLRRSFAADDRRAADLDEILRAAGRASDVTRQLLAFSRQQILQPRVLDLNGVVEGIAGMLRRLLGETCTLELRLAPGLGAVRADQSQVEQALVNLALNARDAMPGDGRVTIETGAAELDDAYLRRRPGVSIVPGRYLMLAVSDTGVGMDAETQARIFEPFFTTKPVGKGTGLGLSTVYGVVKQSGGYIWVYSERGLGTTFKVYLPLVADPAETTRAVPRAEPPRGGSETILIVEDEEVVRELASRALEELGYTVVGARHGREALAELERRRDVRLVITDVVMPEMGGRELAEHLRRDHPSVAVLYMSGYTGDDVVQRGLLDPEAPFQQKPFTPEALGRKVREMLDGRAAVMSGG